MEHIQNAAMVSVGRACGFAGLAIICVMLGLSFRPELAAKAGGVLFLFLALILYMYGVQARTRPYRRTETWLILKKDKRVPADVAQKIVGEVLRETYLRFATHTAIVAVVLIAFSATLKLLGLDIEWGMTAR